MKRVERKWMYERLDANKKMRPEFAQGVIEFLNFAKNEESYKETGELRCPCSKCKNNVYAKEKVVQSHLASKGFVPYYTNWTCHGEAFVMEESNIVENNYRVMVENALPERFNYVREEEMNHAFNDYEDVRYNERPNPENSAFFEILKNAEKPVYEGSDMNLLESASRIIELKCRFNLSQKCVDGFMSYIGDLLPKGHAATASFYETKKLLKALELPHERIDVCIKGCMLFWQADEGKTKCDFCKQDRFKSPNKKGNSGGKGKSVVIESEEEDDEDAESSARRKKKETRKPRKVLIYFPMANRLKRFFGTKQVAEQMRWHHENPRRSGILAHPSDGESWKHFDKEHPEFASEPRNVRLGLCTDGFSPYGKFGKSYSCWPVITTPYNLPPWLCMKKPFMMLSLIVPGPENPKAKLDVYLQPLIQELQFLWEVGVSTYDVSRKQNFQLKAALLWTINDFPAYGMLSGWRTQGKHACPYCTEKEPKSFSLKNSGKVSWFDCHRQFLPMDHRDRWNCPHFRKDRLNEPDVASVRLTGEEEWDRVRHLPKVACSSENLLKSQKGKSEGWWKQSIFWELPYWKTLLIRHNLDVMHIEKNFFEQLINTLMNVPNKTSFGPKGMADMKAICKPRQAASKRFVLDKEQRKALCEWVNNLKFPDGYASDLSRCVDAKNLRLHGLKSHDCHVFMERLLPVALKDLVPVHTWEAITEISQFFRDLCCSTLKVETLTSLESRIAEVICKLEKIFPPSFFNSMEHLPVHLPYEARVGGPVHYRWMYPFERYLNHLKQKIGNKARVEGSICNAYLLEEISNFCSFYFEDHVDTNLKGLDFGVQKHTDTTLPELFQDHDGTTTGKCTHRFLEEKEYNQAHFFILSNCELMKPYESQYEVYIINKYPQLTNTSDVWTSPYDKEFPEWLRNQVCTIKDPLVKALAMGPARKVKTWKRYSINGYKFRAYNETIDLPKATLSNGVCLKSTDGSSFYGILEEIVEIEYTSVDTIYRTILFKCYWIDNSSKGLKVHDTYKLVDVNRKQRYPHYDPFVLSYQVDQVCYAPYPKTRKENQWEAVFKVKARSHVDAPVDDKVFQEDETVLGQTITTPVVIENEEEDEGFEDDAFDDQLNQETAMESEMGDFIVDDDEDEAAQVNETDKEDEEEAASESESDDDDVDDVLFSDDDDT